MRTHISINLIIIINRFYWYKLGNKEIQRKEERKKERKEWKVRKSRKYRKIIDEWSMANLSAHVREEQNRNPSWNPSLKGEVRCALLFGKCGELIETETRRR